MNTQTDLAQTPLQNLFYYIRDLYNAQQNCLDFTQEPGNPKLPGTHYWELGRWLMLAQACGRKHIPEFDLGMFAPSEPGQDYLLKIRRINLPAPPVAPRVDERAEDANTEAAEQWKEYEKAQKAYQTKYALHIQVNECYDALHSLCYELRSRTGKRLHLSFGLVHGMIGGTAYKNFLFHVPLRLKLKNHEIRIEADTFAYKITCEQYFTELLDAHFPKEPASVVEERKKEVLLAVDRFNSQSLECFFNADFIRTEYFDKGLEILGVFPQKESAFFAGDLSGDFGQGANTSEDGPQAGLPQKVALDFNFHGEMGNQPILFSFSPVVQTKMVADQIAISRDAAAIIRNINELHSSGSLDRIPDFFKKLFSLPSDTREEEEPLNLIELVPEIVLDQRPNRYLFPLPYNQEQFDIAERLMEQDAVTVKGPPGTGKSHTIANLISHFVSEGKSILVVSHNAKALSVLKDKIPKGIQDLAVSLVNEGKGNEGLKASVSAIIRHISGRYEADRIEALEGQLSALENKYALLLGEMYKVVQANSEKLELVHPNTRFPEERSAYEWAVYMHEEDPRNPVLLKDTVDFTSDTTGLAEKLQSLTVISNQFQPEDFDLMHYRFLEDHAFPELQQLRRIEVRLEEIAQHIRIVDYAEMDPAVADEAFLSEFEELDDQWKALSQTEIAQKLFLHPDFDKATLRKLLLDYMPLRNQVEAADNTLLSYELDLTPLHGTDPDQLYKMVNQLIVRFGDNQQLGWMSRNLMDKHMKLFFTCRINYNYAIDLEHFKLIETSINRDRQLKQLSITFQNYLRKFGMAAPDIQSLLKELDLLSYFEENLGTFNAGLRERKMPPYDPTNEAQRKYLSGLTQYAEYQKIHAGLKQIKERLIDHEHAHPLIFNIARSLEFVNRANYELYFSQYREKRLKQPASIRFDQLYKEVGRILPQTVVYIKDRGMAGVKLFPTASDIEMDLFHARLHSFLTHIVAQTKQSGTLLADLQKVKRAIEKQTAELISYKAWYYKAQKVNDIQKAALNAWLNDLINIGKGFGKNTARNMASAVRNMQIAKEAVPIWIMPQETAITFFPDASPGQFDLLIIDEASQCDISGLNLVYRCKKCLIVGDENQTSVSADRSVFSIDRTNDLLDKYLISHRFKTQFDVNNKNNSIYTISGVIYPNIVTLTEHFRCLPEIIGYSNQYMYNKDIVPLKTATEHPFGDPIALEYTEDNPDSEEKPLLVRSVAQAIEAYILRYREGKIKRLPTIGIITLDGANQAHQQALLREVAASELIKQYEDSLDLLIGTSREFQGDERDVMLLTITASHSIRKEGERYTFRPPRAATTEEYMRIYNVAASRAKERSVLFHTIHPEAIALMNPACYRKRLLDYYQGQQHKLRAQDVSAQSLPTLLERVDAFAGDFQSSVCRFLYENGLGDFLFPQMEIGKYRIDFGIILHNRKLAIECDGDIHYAGMDKIREDIARQLILERANWHFFRIQSADWFYRRKAVGEALLKWIRDNTQPEETYLVT